MPAGAGYASRLCTREKRPERTHFHQEILKYKVRGDRIQSSKPQVHVIAKGSGGPVVQVAEVTEVARRTPCVEKLGTRALTSI